VALEAGLGGTYDSTNVVDPTVSVITSIGRDHLAVLGPTLADVASNKAGIIKPGRPAVVHCADESAMQVIATEAAVKGSPLTVIGRDVTWQGQSLGLDDGGPATAPLGAQRVNVTGPGWSLSDIIVPLAGPHQQINAATAVAALKQLVADGARITDDDIRRGIAATTWPGRLEVMGRQPLVIIDGAHNPEAAVALAAAVRPIGRRRTILVLGMLVVVIIGERQGDAGSAQPFTQYIERKASAERRKHDRRAARLHGRDHALRERRIEGRPLGIVARAPPNGGDHRKGAPFLHGRLAIQHLKALRLDMADEPVELADMVVAFDEAQVERGGRGGRDDVA
jgi:folylpolyglutamate synthase/dihydrofolate synthase